MTNFLILLALHLCVFAAIAAPRLSNSGYGLSYEEDCGYDYR